MTTLTALDPILQAQLADLAPKSLVPGYVAGVYPAGRPQSTSRDIARPGNRRGVASGQPAPGLVGWEGRRKFLFLDPWADRCSSLPDSTDCEEGEQSFRGLAMSNILSMIVGVLLLLGATAHAYRLFRPLAFIVGSYSVPRWYSIFFLAAEGYAGVTLLSMAFN